MDHTTNVTCEHCGEEMRLGRVARMGDKAVIDFTIKPSPDEYLGTSVLAEYIRNVGKTLIASGNEMGMKTVVMVRNITSHEDGGFTFTVVVCRQGFGLQEEKEAHTRKVVVETEEDKQP